MCTHMDEHKREHVNTETDRLTDDTNREIETEARSKNRVSKLLHFISCQAVSPLFFSATNT